MDRRARVSCVDISGRRRGGGGPAYLIAEIGTNHGGDLNRAKRLVEACSKAGADGVKFQSWTAGKLQAAFIPGPDGKMIPSPALPILKKYELPEAWHAQLAQFCHDLGIDFLSTPFDPAKARLLHSLGVPALKVASGDLTYADLLKEIGSLGRPVFMSTGMAHLGEVEAALNRLDPENRLPVVLMHCVGAYPPDFEDANLLALVTLSAAFNRPVGLSDHFPGHALALAAIALGACAIEKHVTDSRSAGHPDSPFALEMDEFKAMVVDIRRLESALGDGLKKPRKSELGGRVGGRRCLHAARDLRPGDLLEPGDLAVVRPNDGPIQPDQASIALGRRVRRPVLAGAALTWDDLEPA